MVVQTELALKRPAGQIRVPLTSVRGGFGQPPHVLIVLAEGDVVAAREVTLGPVRGNQVQIASGLSGHERLIVRGQHFVVPGDRVRPQLISSDLARQGQLPEVEP